MRFVRCICEKRRKRKHKKASALYYSCFLHYTVTRVQFFAIEIARNRAGLNLALRKVSPKAENKEMKQTLTKPDDAKTEEVAS